MKNEIVVEQLLNIPKESWLHHVENLDILSVTEQFKQFVVSNPCGSPVR